MFIHYANWFTGKQKGPLFRKIRYKQNRRTKQKSVQNTENAICQTKNQKRKQKQQVATNNRRITLLFVTPSWSKNKDIMKVGPARDPLQKVECAPLLVSKKYDKTEVIRFSYLDIIDLLKIIISY